METAPLTEANAHAWRACSEGLSSAAIAEHELAAGKFHDAATGTQDPEALRILKLLEDQHHHLAHILRRQSSQAIKPKTKPAVEDEEGATSPVDTLPNTQDGSPTAADSVVPRSSVTKAITKTQAKRRGAREMSSSIANSLATARGIPDGQSRRSTPGSPTTPVAAGRVSRQGGPHRIESQMAPSTPTEAFRTAVARNVAQLDRSESTRDSTRNARGIVSPGVLTEDGFQKFYSKFEGLFSVISAPLAFAALPLTSNIISTPTERPTEPQVKPTTVEQPDLTKIISKPTLRALKDDHGLKGPFVNASESFFLVPTTGGTVSYAGILSHSNSSHHSQNSHLPGLTEEEGDVDGDEFVDASETPVPPSPTATRTFRGRGKSANQQQQPAPSPRSRKTSEELELENTTLRQLLDKQSRRLQMWEATSQSQSLALAQSFRSRGPPSLSSGKSDVSNADIPPVPPLPSGNATTATISSPERRPPPSSSSASTNTTPRDTATAARIRELEAALKQQTFQSETLARDFEKVAKENEKKAEMLQRYRDRWEQLKADARKKRPKGGGGHSTDGGSSNGAITREATPAMGEGELD